MMEKKGSKEILIINWGTRYFLRKFLNRLGNGPTLHLCTTRKLVDKGERFEDIIVLGEGSVKNKMSFIFSIRRIKYKEIFLLFNWSTGIGIDPKLELLSFIFRGKKRYIITSWGDEIELNWFNFIMNVLGRLTGIKYAIDGKKGWRDYILCLISKRLRMSRILGKPIYMTIEPTNVCNLKCPVCETGSGILKRKKGTLKFENYRMLLEKIRGFTNTILLYYMGESFLNKDIYKIISLTKKMGIKVLICTNGEDVDPRGLVDSGIDYVNFIVGGASQKAHEGYRVNGDLGKTVNNLRELVRIKQENSLRSPIIQFDMIVMRQSEHEIDEFLTLAEEIGVDECDLIAPCVRNYEQAMEYLPENEQFILYDRDLLRQGKLAPKDKVMYKNMCDWIWFSTVVTWDGAVVPCCRDVFNHYEMGNLFDGDFSDIWNNDKYKAFREKILRNQKQIRLCHNCFGYSKPNLL